MEGDESEDSEAQVGSIYTEMHGGWVAWAQTGPRINLQDRLQTEQAFQPTGNQPDADVELYRSIEQGKMGKADLKPAKEVREI